MLKSIIIDDEKHCRSLLKWAIEANCSNVEILKQCSSGTEGIAAIQTHQPDLVFLDIEMRDMTGFEMLERLGKIDCDIIFTTAYDQFAINAFKVNAVDYLLKPIDKNELSFAVNKFKSNFHNQNEEVNLSEIRNLISNNSKVYKLRYSLRDAFIDFTKTNLKLSSKIDNRFLKDE